MEDGKRNEKNESNEVVPEEIYVFVWLHASSRWGKSLG